MDDPKLAAELLRKHNPYDAQVMGRRMLRDWGLSVPQRANIANEELDWSVPKSRSTPMPQNTTCGPA